jgi:hypothetical protein
LVLFEVDVDVEADAKEVGEGERYSGSVYV